MIKQSLLKRKPKSDVASKFVSVLSRDQKDRPRSLLVPGSEAKRYQVIVRRYGRTMTLECLLEIGRGHIKCPGNGPQKDHSKETICYHSRAAADFCIEHTWDPDKQKWVKSGFKGSWCTNKEDANRVFTMIGGTIFNIKSHQNSQGLAWVVVRKTK